MDRKRFDGNRWQVAGALKEAVGRLAGNRRLEAEGAAEKEAGEVRVAAGKGADKLPDAD